MPELNAKMIIELALCRMAALCEIPTWELAHLKAERFLRIAAHYARAEEACDCLGNALLKERISHFECLARNPNMVPEEIEPIRLELEFFIAQLQGMSAEEYADWEQSLKEQQLCIPGLGMEMAA